MRTLYGSMFVSLLLAGCAGRSALTGEDLKEGASEPLPVYVSHRTIPVYERDQYQLRRRISRNDAGIIVDEDVSDGARRLWISFSSRCRSTDCAYGFVETKDGQFRLANLPEKKDYETAKAYQSRIGDRHELRLDDPQSSKTVVLEVERG